MNQELEKGESYEFRFTPNSDRNRVLILDDSHEISLIYERYCKRMNLNYDIADSVKEALHKVESAESPYNVFVVDLMLPEENGLTFIKSLKERDPDAIVIIQSSSEEPDKIIEVMKLGVFDYLIKPVSSETFQKTIQLAFQYYDLRLCEENTEKLNRDVLKEQLDWLTYKESLRKSDENSILISTIKSLSTSFSQGSGIGSIVSLLDLLKMGDKNSNEGAQVSQELLELLYSNQEILRKQLNALSEILSIAEEDPNTERIHSSKLVELLKKSSEGVCSYLNRKELKLRFSKRKTKDYIRIQTEWIQIAFEELLLNALKYSKPKTFIDVYFGEIDGYFCIAVKNNVEEIQPLVDSELKEVLVTRPFYRVLPPVEEFTNLEQYGLGLGLTAVDLIVNKHRGIFNIHNVMDHTATEVEPCVMAEIFLPLDSKSNTAGFSSKEGVETL